MWKRIDNDFYDTLRAAHNNNYTPDCFTYPLIFLLLELFIIIPVLAYGQYPSMFIPLSAAAVLITLPFFIFGLSLLSKNKNIKDRIIAANNAEYHPAALVSKYSRASGSGYNDSANLFVGVRLNGKIIKVRTRKDVYSVCREGDSIYVVDLIGEKAASPYTCIAVVNIPENNYNSGFSNSFINDCGDNFNNGYNTFSGNSSYQQQFNSNMQYGIPMNYSENKMYETGRIITDEERDHLIKIEDRKYKKLKIATIVLGLFTLVLIAATIIFKIRGDWRIEKISETFLIVSGIFFVLILLGFLISITPYKSLKDRLRYENLRVEDIVIQDIKKTSYRSGRYKHAKYYYTCRSDQGRVFVADNSKPYAVKAGGRALTVHLGKDMNNPSIYSPIIKRR